jgi:hypothetical protein
MEVSVVSFADAASMSEVSISEDPSWINVFEIQGTDGCQLDCPEWKTILSLHGQPRQRQQITAFYKSQRLKRGLKTSRLVNESLSQVKRGHFSLLDLNKSSRSGCCSCELLHAILTQTFSTRTGLDPCQLVLEWIGYGFLLDATEGDTDKSFTIQLYRLPGKCSTMKQRQ